MTYLFFNKDSNHSNSEDKIEFSLRNVVTANFRSVLIVIKDMVVTQWIL